MHKMTKRAPPNSVCMKEAELLLTGENTSPADSWPRDSSSSTFWEYEMLRRVWSQNMEYKDAGCCVYSLAFYQLTVLSPTLHDTIQLGNYLAGGAWRDDYPPVVSLYQCVSRCYKMCRTAVCFCLRVLKRWSGCYNLIAPPAAATSPPAPIHYTEGGHQE